MTLSLLAVGLAGALWPRADPQAVRIKRLQAEHRLPPGIRSPRATWWSAAPLLDHGLLRPRSALVAAVVAGAAVSIAVAATPTFGQVAATEFAICIAVVSVAAISTVRVAVGARRQVTRTAQVSLAVTLLARELDAGATPAAALRSAGEVGVELTRRLGNPDQGSHRADLAGRFVDVDGDRDRSSRDGSSRDGERGGGDAVDDPLARVVLAWRMSARTGAPLAEVLARVRADLADGAATRRDVQAAVAGPKASASLLALLPMLGLALGAAMGADPVAILIATPAGRILLCLGVVLDAAGVLWSNRLVRRAQR